MPESRVARADRRTTAILVRLGPGLRLARAAAGLTLEQVARAVGISDSEVSRIERSEAPWVDVAALSRVAAVVGLDLWLRTYPGEEPLRDKAHLRLGEAFADLVAAPVRIRGEVPVGDRRDRRAWDLTLTDPTDARCAVELETRFVDAQAQHRRIMQKLEDSDTDRVLVVVADTRANRAAVRAASGLLRTTFALEHGAAVEALRSGRLPPHSALIFVPSRGRGSPSRGADDA